MSGLVSGTWAAPGRVNLIGEHTDYNDGFCLPFALPQQVTVTASVGAPGLWVVRSSAYPDAVEFGTDDEPINVIPAPIVRKLGAGE